MATVKLFLSTQPTKDGYPIRLRFSAKSERADITLDAYVQPENWNKVTQMVLSTEPNFKVKNKLIRERLDAAEAFLQDLTRKGRLVNNATKLRDLFLSDKKPTTFLDYMQEFVDGKTGKTKEVYQSTLSRLKVYSKSDIYFEDITPTWLNQFDAWCKLNGNKMNTRGVHMRNIRAIFNSAISDRKISADLYPFKAFKIEKEDTDKRTLTIGEFRRVLRFTGTPIENWAKDVFLLSFYLLGINLKDLFELDTIDNGEVKYRKSKTGSLFNITLEPEAIEIINRFKGEKSLLNFSDTILHHENFIKKVNEYLEKIVTSINLKEEKRQSDFRMRKFTTYAARHSWATFAAELDIPEKDISMALGHQSPGNTTTAISIKYNHKKVIEANRKVIDYVFGIDASEQKKILSE